MTICEKRCVSLRPFAAHFDTNRRRCSAKKAYLASDKNLITSVAATEDLAPQKVIFKASVVIMDSKKSDLTAVIKPAFWIKLEKKKLEELKLDEQRLDIYVFLSLMDKGPGRFVYFDEYSFSSFRPYPYLAVPLHGSLRVYNTPESLLANFAADKAWMNEKTLNDLKSGTCPIFHPLLTCYSDPKTHRAEFLVYCPVVDLFSEANKLVKCLKVPRRSLCSVEQETEWALRVKEQLEKGAIPNTFFKLESRKSESSSEEIFWFISDEVNAYSLHPSLWNIVAYHLFFLQKDIVTCILSNPLSEGGIKRGFVLRYEKQRSLDFATIKFVSLWKKSCQQLAKTDYSLFFDPTRIAEHSFTLNVKLMKWQAYPDLKLDSIFSLRCLIIGAGTLGCNLARCLLGWGVSNITFVDDANVSYSNPPRQSLYTVDDAISEAGKAEAAARAVMKTYPSANCKGVKLRIPEPGHIVSAKEFEQLKATYSQVEQLVEQHDVVFLLTDNRESRWLPTSICVVKNKLAICGALGIDSLLVMRHSFSAPAGASGARVDGNYLPSNQLGCYFCADMCYPANSEINRRIDQKCSITRPGACFIATGLIVELLISLTQHPHGFSASAPLDNQDQEESPLGRLPHTIRYCLSEYSLLSATSRRFSNCPACSPPVVHRLRTCGSEFVFEVCNHPEILSVISGLDEFNKEAEKELLKFELN